MINSFKNPAIMRILRTTERYEAGWREQNFIPDDEIDSLMFEQYLKENHMTLEDYHASQEAFRAKHGYPGYY